MILLSFNVLFSPLCRIRLSLTLPPVSEYPCKLAKNVLNNILFVVNGASIMCSYNLLIENVPSVFNVCVCMYVPLLLCSHAVKGKLTFASNDLLSKNCKSLTSSATSPKDTHTHHISGKFHKTMSYNIPLH